MREVDLLYARHIRSVIAEVGLHESIRHQSPSIVLVSLVPSIPVCNKQFVAVSLVVIASHITYFQLININLHFSRILFSFS